MNGQSGVVAGQKPVAWWKVWLAIAALLLPGTITSLLGLPLIALAGIGAIPMVIGMILLLIGLVISGVILKQAFKADNT